MRVESFWIVSAMNLLNLFHFLHLWRSLQWITRRMDWWCGYGGGCDDVCRWCEAIIIAAIPDFCSFVCIRGNRSNESSTSGCHCQNAFMKMKIYMSSRLVYNVLWCYISIYFTIFFANKWENVLLRFGGENLCSVSTTIPRLFSEYLFSHPYQCTVQFVLFCCQQQQKPLRYQKINKTKHKHDTHRTVFALRHNYLGKYKKKTRCRIKM